MITRTREQPFLPLLHVFGDEQTSAIFSEYAVIEGYLEVERTLAAAEADIGVIPHEAAEVIQREVQIGKIDFDALRRGTLKVGYPILPLLEQLRANSGPDVAKYIHWGATTQDIMDTALAVRISLALDRLSALLSEVGDQLASRASDSRDMVMVARTHGQPAVPTTFGAKVAVWLSELTRHRQRLADVRTHTAIVELFGAAGTGAALGQQSRVVRHRLAARLALEDTDIPWHTTRDGLAELVFVLAAISATCGKIAREVIDLSRPELGEVQEVTGYYRGASSAMPQKANPIDSEVVVGLSLVAQGFVPTMLMAMQGRHERAAGEWQAEWDAIPMAFVVAASALAGTARILRGLQVFPEQMRANLERDGGLVMAEAVMMAAALSLGRGHAHELVYEACRLVRQERLDLATAVRRAAGDISVEVDFEAALDPKAYLGETNGVVSAAVENWRAART